MGCRPSKSAKMLFFQQNAFHFSKNTFTTVEKLITFRIYEKGIKSCGLQAIRARNYMLFRVKHIARRVLDKSDTLK